MIPTTSGLYKTFWIAIIIVSGTLILYIDTMLSLVMAHLLLYTFLGATIALLSLLNLNIMVNNRGVKEFVSKRIEMAKWHTAIILITIFITYMVGMLYLAIRSEVMREFMILVAIVLWTGLLVVEATTFRKLIGDGFRPKASKDFLNYIFYFGVLWLLFDRFTVPWAVIGTVSTVFVVAIVYFAVMLWKYSKIIHVLVEPLDLYTPAIGVRFFSALVGIILMSYGHSEGVFRGFIAIGFVVLAVVVWYSAMNMEKLVRM